MGQQSRLKRARREERLREPRNLPSLKDEPFRVLKAIHKTIQDHCHESGRRCWEYLLEMIAHSSGWQTDTCEAKHLWDKMANEDRWGEFLESWMAEVEWAKRNRAPFSEPFGELLEHIEGTNDSLGQYFTPMSIVRVMNEMTIGAIDETHTDGMPTHRALDPCVGTGRFMIDALVHNDGLLMHGVDLDLWMLRCAMLNVRLLAKWTSLHLHDPDDRLRPLRAVDHLIANATEEPEGTLERPVKMHRTRNPFDAMLERAHPVRIPEERSKDGAILLIGGRSIFMHGDATVLDLGYTPNWVCAGWHWLPRPWRGNLKIEGYFGTYEQWVEDGRPPLGEQSKEIQFDYSMVEKTTATEP